MEGCVHILDSNQYENQRSSMVDISTPKCQHHLFNLVVLQHTISQNNLIHIGFSPNHVTLSVQCEHLRSDFLLGHYYNLSIYLSLSEKCCMHVRDELVILL